MDDLLTTTVTMPDAIAALEQTVSSMPETHRASLLTALEGVAQRNRHDSFRRGFFLSLADVMRAAKPGGRVG